MCKERILRIQVRSQAEHVSQVKAKLTDSDEVALEVNMSYEDVISTS